jgi:hypothetical protein
MKTALVAAACVLSMLRSDPAGADVTVFLCEPYGQFGFLVPQGHIALYFDRICADSPTALRACLPGETGVVISRYLKVAGLDWMAMPLIPWLYAVDRAADVPPIVDKAQVAAMRNAYREAHLREYVPNARDGRIPNGNWYQLVGAAYDRRIVAFTINTTSEQDELVMRTLNDEPNRSRFNWALRNCADFVQDIVNLYYPGAMKTSAVSDLGLTTPKQVVKSLVKYCDRRPELALRSFFIAQIPGSRKASGSPKGVLESLVKEPVYLVPLVVIQPWVPVALAGGYVVGGRFNTKKTAVGSYDPPVVEDWARAASSSAAASAPAAAPATAPRPDVAAGPPRLGDEEAPGISPFTRK